MILLIWHQSPSTFLSSILTLILFIVIANYHTSLVRYIYRSSSFCKHYTFSRNLWHVLEYTRLPLTLFILWNVSISCVLSKPIKKTSETSPHMRIAPWHQNNHNLSHLCTTYMHMSHMLMCLLVLFISDS